MNRSTTNERIASVYRFPILGCILCASDDERSVVYRRVANGSRVEDLGAKAVGGTIECEGRVGKRQTVSTVEAT
jgi:hypothetical protein